MIEDRWGGIGVLGCGTLGDNLTFYLPELLCRVCHGARGAASSRAACAVCVVCTACTVCAVRAVRLDGLSAPSSETQPSAISPRPSPGVPGTRGSAVCPAPRLSSTPSVRHPVCSAPHLSGTPWSHRCLSPLPGRWEHIARTGSASAAATRSCQTRSRSPSCPSSPPPPRI